MSHSFSVELKNEKAILEHVLENIKQKCDIEALAQALMVPITEPENRLCYYTDLPFYLISKLLPTRKKTTSLDLSTRVLILNIIKNQYESSCVPLDYSSMFNLASQVGITKNINHTKRRITDLNEFVEEMKILGYEIKETTSNQNILVENPEFRFERLMYLNKKIKINASNNWKNIVYLDERIVGSDMKFQKPWLSDKVYDYSKEFILYHAVTTNGFICGLHTNQASYRDFYKWVTDILLGQLKEPSVIIMDNSPLHGTLENLCPLTMYHSKSEMVEWLNKNNVPCSMDMIKPDLYDLIKKVNKNNMEYKVDKIIRAHGHEVLRLPQYLYDLSITTNLWEDIINEMKSKIIKDNNAIVFQNTIMDQLRNISTDVWNKYGKFVEHIENKIFGIDTCIDNLIDGVKLVNNEP